MKCALGQVSNVKTCSANCSLWNEGDSECYITTLIKAIIRSM